jgi:hypothetical protein
MAPKVQYVTGWTESDWQRTSEDREGDPDHEEVNVRYHIALADTDSPIRVTNGGETDTVYEGDRIRTTKTFRSHEAMTEYLKGQADSGVVLKDAESPYLIRKI